MIGILYATVYTGVLLGLVKGLQVAGEETTIPWWLLSSQGWLIAIALAVAVYIKRQNPSAHAWVFAAIFPVAIALVSFWGSFATDAPTETWQEAADNWYREVNLVRAGDLGLMWIYATFFALVAIFWPVRKTDLTAKAVAAILWLGECYMLAEHFVCNFIWPVEGSAVIAAKVIGEDKIYACSRVDLSGLIWAPAVLQIGVLLLLGHYLRRAKRRME